MSSDRHTTAPSDVVTQTQSGAHKSNLTRDLTEGSIPRNLWFLAWPQTVEGALSIVDQLADILWAGRLGARSIAGLGVAQNYTSLAMTGRMGFDMAMRAMVARAVGARDIPTANHVALQAFTLSGAFSLLMVVVGVFFTEPMLRLLGLSDAVVAAGAGYMKVQFVGMGAVALRMTSAAALQASGDAVTPLKATTVVRIVHLMLSPCLVFGWLFFPELGLAGAAVASAFAQLIGGAMNLRSLFAGKSRLHLSFKGYRIDFPLLWQIVKIGAPASVSTAERTIAQIMLVGIVAPFGDYALAAYSLTRRVEMVPNFAMMGVGQATGTLVGQSLGAGKPGRAMATVGWSLSLSTLFHIALAIILFVLAEPVLSLFNQQPELLAPAVIWLRIQVVGYVFMGAGMIFMQTFNTAGDTLVTMIVSMASVWTIQQPLALTLPGLLGIGEFGVGWAINIALALRLLVFTPYFFWGRWMKRNPLAVRQRGGPLPRRAEPGT